MPSFDSAAAVANAHAIDEQHNKIKQLRSARMTARLLEMSMQGRGTSLERHAAKLKVREADQQIECAVLDLGALEKSMATHIAAAYADIESNRLVEAAVAQAHSQPATAAKSRAPAGASSGLAGVYADLDPESGLTAIFAATYCRKPSSEEIQKMRAMGFQGLRLPSPPPL